jgi:hypothetical protein
LQSDLTEGDEEEDQKCVNLEEPDKEGDVIGVSLQVIKTAAESVIGPKGSLTLRIAR